MKMWSGRFRQPLDPEFEKWQRSFPYDQRLLPFELAASRAHANALEHAGVLSSEDLSEIVKALEEIGLGDFIRSLPQGVETEVNERGSTLSVGQRQLISFARALAHNPRFLILDEATSSVDTKTELLIREALDRLLSGRTALVIAHRLSTIQHADRILVFHKGRLREEGAHQELLALRGIYYRLYQLQYKEQELPETNGVAGATVLPAPTPASD